MVMLDSSAMEPAEAPKDNNHCAEKGKELTKMVGPIPAIVRKFDKVSKQMQIDAKSAENFQKQLSAVQLQLTRVGVLGKDDSSLNI